jgi:hypothetical protein
MTGAEICGAVLAAAGPARRRGTKPIPAAIKEKQNCDNMEINLHSTAPKPSLLGLSGRRSGKPRKPLGILMASAGQTA